MKDSVKIFLLLLALSSVKAKPIPGADEELERDWNNDELNDDEWDESEDDWDESSDENDEKDWDEDWVDEEDEKDWDEEQDEEDWEKEEWENDEGEQSLTYKDELDEEKWEDEDEDDLESAKVAEPAMDDGNDISDDDEGSSLKLILMISLLTNLRARYFGTIPE